MELLTRIKSDVKREYPHHKEGVSFWREETKRRLSHMIAGDDLQTFSEKNGVNYPKLLQAIRKENWEAKSVGFEYDRSGCINHSDIGDSIGAKTSAWSGKSNPTVYDVLDWLEYHVNQSGAISSGYLSTGQSRQAIYNFLYRNNIKKWRFKTTVIQDKSF